MGYTYPSTLLRRRVVRKDSCMAEKAKKKKRNSSSPSSVMTPPPVPEPRAMPSDLLNAVGDAVRFATYYRRKLLVTTDEPHYTYVLRRNNNCWSNDNTYIRSVFNDCNKWFAARVEASKHSDFAGDDKEKYRYAVINYLYKNVESATERRLKACLLQLESLVTSPNGFKGYVCNDWHVGQSKSVLRHHKFPYVYLAQHNELNASHDSLPFANGIVDLSKGSNSLSLLPSASAAKKFWTVENPLEWRGPTNADFEEAMEFWDVYGSDISIYLRTCLADSLLGYGGQRKLHFITGPPSGGKTTMVKALKNAFGDELIVTASREVFEHNRYGQPSNDPGILDLRSSRIITLDESENQYFNVSRLNAFSGDSSFAASYKYENAKIQFIPKGRIFILANNVPQQLGSSHPAFLDRLWAIHLGELKNPNPNMHIRTQGDLVLGLALANDLVSLCADLVERRANGETTNDIYSEFEELNNEFKGDVQAEEYRVEIDYLLDVLEEDEDGRVYVPDITDLGNYTRGVIKPGIYWNVLDAIVKQAFSDKVEVVRKRNWTHPYRNRRFNGNWIVGVSLTKEAMKLLGYKSKSRSFKSGDDQLGSTDEYSLK